MKKFFIPLAVLALALGLSTTTFAQEKPGEQVTVTIKGWVTDTSCGAKGAVAEHDPAKCVKEKGAKWAIYNEEDKTILILANPEIGPKMVGKEITVKGTMDKKKKEIKVSDWNFV